MSRRECGKCSHKVKSSGVPADTVARFVFFCDTYKTVARRLSRPTRCRVRCSSAVLRSCFPRSNINRATLLLQLATHQRCLPRHAACGSSPRHCHGGSVRPRSVFRYLCASGLCGRAAYPRDSSSQVSDWPEVSSLSIPFLSTCTEGAQRRGTAEHSMTVYETVNHLLPGPSPRT